MDSVACNDHRMTVAQFLAAVASDEAFYELVDGIPVKVLPSRARNSRIQVNLTSKIDTRLGDSPCQIYGSRMGLKLGDYDFRLPSAAIYCDPVEIAPANDDAPYFNHPRVVFEIFPSAPHKDMATRVLEYQTLKSVDTIVLVDSENLRLTTWTRNGCYTWAMTELGQGSPLHLRDPAIVLTAGEIFRR